MNTLEVVDVAEQIKWWDAQDALGRRALREGLQVARECRHPDAQWLAALFPRGADAEPLRMREVMLTQGEDPRALFIAWLLRSPTKTVGTHLALLTQAAKMGYAPAQAMLSAKGRGDQIFLWAEQAAVQGDRNGLYQFGHCFLEGFGHGKDLAHATKLFREAAELEHAQAQWKYGEVGFGKLDWERYHWWARAASKGESVYAFCCAAIDLLPWFENGEKGRILYIMASMASLIAKYLVVRRDKLFSLAESREKLEKYQRLIQLNKVVLDRARLAIACWSVVGRRCGVAKDMRVMVAKMAWEEPWRWGEAKNENHGEALSEGKRG
jgi:hypothetical protein